MIDMEAPNKIYMPNELLTEDWQRHISGQDTEYIRKDAVLAILEERRNAYKKEADEYHAENPNLPFTYGQAHAFKEAIEKINSI